MKLLFDQNLSHWLVDALRDLFPGSTHVREHGLERADDRTVWQFARDQNLVLVSKDADFPQYSLLYGYPPKVIWLRCGNCTTRDLLAMLRAHVAIIRDFWEDSETSVIVLPV